MKFTNNDLENINKMTFSPDIHNNNGNIYKLNDKFLIKIFKDSTFIEEVERNTEYQINNNIPNTPRVYEKVYIGNQFSGYMLENILNSMTFRAAINSDLDYSLRKSAIIDVYEALKYLHERDIFLGDIHSDNFLITEDGQGFLIDLDYMRFRGDEYKFQQCYLIKPNNNSYKINVASNYTDNVKVMVSSLSLLYNIDLETLVNKKDFSLNIEDIKKHLAYLNDNKLNDYLTLLCEKQEVPYFTDYYFDRLIDKKER